MAFDNSSRKAGSRLSSIVGHLAPSVQASQSSVTQPVAAAGKYKYTVEGKVLTKEQRDHYEKNGFIVFKRLIPEKDLDYYKSRFLDICTGKAGQGAFFTIMRDVSMGDRKNQWGENSITKLQDWHDDEQLFKYCTHPAVVRVVNDIIGKDCRSIHTMLINKPPDLGKGSSRHPPHQDLWYFPHRPAERIVASWTAMQKIDTENGCLFVKPGSHRGELLKHEYPNDGIVNKAYHGIQNMTEEDGKKLLMLEMEPGDTVFFHPLLIHGSGRNNSKGYRKAISCHYAAADCEFIDAKGTIQEELAKELEDMAKTRMRAFGDVTLSFHDLWKMKSRHVSGKDAPWAM